LRQTYTAAIPLGDRSIIGGDATTRNCWETSKSNYLGYLRGGVHWAARHPTPAPPTFDEVQN